MDQPDVMDPLFDSDVLRMAERRALACVCKSLYHRVRELHSPCDVLLDPADCDDRGNGKFVRQTHARRWLQRQPMRLCVRDPHGGEEFAATFDVSAEWPYIDSLRPIDLQSLRDKTLAHFLPWVLYRLGANRTLTLRENLPVSWDDIEHGRCRLVEYDGTTKLVVRHLPTVYWILLEGICALEADERVANRHSDAVSLAHLYLNEREATRLGEALYTRERPLRSLDLSSCRVIVRSEGICGPVCLAKATLPELLSLTLQRNPLHASEVRDLSRAIQEGRFPVLSTLNLRSTQLTSQDMWHLCRALTCLSSSLDHLDLSNNLFNNEGLEHFIAETRLARLTGLSLGGSSGGINSKGLIRLARHLRAAAALPRILHVVVPHDANPFAKDLVRHAVNEVRAARSYEAANNWALRNYPDA